MTAQNEMRLPLRRTLAKLALAVLPFVVLVFGSFLLPRTPFDGRLARVGFWVAESGSYRGLPILIGIALLIIVSRPSGGRLVRRIQELTLLIGVLMVFLLGAAKANESLLKPLLGIPRPNIVALSEAGMLHMKPKQFYQLGDKAARTVHLKRVLKASAHPELRLDPLVRDHWAEETGFSFPSGHATAAMTSACFMVGLMLLFGLGGWRRALWLALPWATAVCYSRPLLGVHSALDVSVGSIQGTGLGLLAVMVVAWAMGRFWPEPAA